MSIKPSDIKVTLLSDVRTYYHWIEIVVKQCRNNGIQCKVSILFILNTLELSSNQIFKSLSLLFNSQVHGVNIIGRRKQTDLDLMLMNAGFLATEYDSSCEPSSSTSYTYPDDRSSKDQMQCKVLAWGLNDKEQLGGLKGSKVKVPTFSATLSQLRPIHLSGGSKSLFIVSQDGKVSHIFVSSLH